MPKNAPRFTSLRPSECLFWAVEKWQGYWADPHRRQFLAGLEEIKPVMESIDHAGADTAYIRFLLETWTLVEYLEFPWDRVARNLARLDKALEELTELAREGLLPGESVKPLLTARNRLLLGELGEKKKRYLQSEIFVNYVREHRIAGRQGRPGWPRFHTLAYLISTHLEEHKVQPR